MSDSPLESSRRTLAAIVFTDIVDFSARVQESEEHALGLAQRDLALIRQVCEKSQGRVLKSTGDGLLMYFDSAVQAVVCGLEVQQRLAEAAKSLPPEQVLMHRIGIHLGDVFVSASDVMGDGVNVASRLQAEAEPGGICFSQTVYDVVKNRLGIQATYMGPRALKNIQEAVPVYQILLGASTGGRSKRRSSRSPWLVRAVIAIGVIVVALAVGLIIVFTRQAPNRGQGGSGGGDGPAITDGGNTPLAIARREALQMYDFARMVKWLEQNPQKDAGLRDRYTRLVDLRRMIMVRVGSASEEQPITARMPTGEMISVWQGDGGKFRLKVGDTAVQTVELAQLSPHQLVRLAVAATAAGSKSREAVGILAEELFLAGRVRERPTLE